jgi:hypothetical protein
MFKKRYLLTPLLLLLPLGTPVAEHPNLQPVAPTRRVDSLLSNAGFKCTYSNHSTSNWFAAYERFDSGYHLIVHHSLRTKSSYGSFEMSFSFLYSDLRDSEILQLRERIHDAVIGDSTSKVLVSPSYVPGSGQQTRHAVTADGLSVAFTFFDERPYCFQVIASGSGDEYEHFVSQLLVYVTTQDWYRNRGILKEE